MATTYSSGQEDKRRVECLNILESQRIEFELSLNEQIKSLSESLGVRVAVLNEGRSVSVRFFDDESFTLLG